MRDLKDFLETLIKNIHSRLLENEAEQNVIEHCRVLTEYKLMFDLAQQYEVEQFVVRAMEERDFIASVRSLTSVSDLSNSALEK